MWTSSVAGLLEAQAAQTLWEFVGFWIYKRIVQTLTTKDCKGPQTNMPENAGSINTWSAKIKSRHIKFCSRILQCWSYYVKINSARHQRDTERTQNTKRSVDNLSFPSMLLDCLCLKSANFCGTFTLCPREFPVLTFLCSLSVWSVFSLKT